MTNEEKARVLSGKASLETYFNEEAQKQYPNPSTETIARINAYGACMEMAQWKDEQHEQSLIDLNCKLEEQQENYEELKKRYNEAIERERIATKIINELRQKLNKK